MILHSDLNCFYASAEINEDPSLLGKKVAVCGDTESRHGIVLTASYPAKKSGVKTGMANWEARRACPDLICLKPRYELYLRYSRMVRRIYSRYADDIEPFGMDECWLGINGLTCPDRQGMELADEIRRTVRRETGLTVSIGVSFCKVFAKLGSDMKKPDAITLVSRSNYQSLVWPLPAKELLYVGSATQHKLHNVGIDTIGDIALADPALLQCRLGKNGLMLRRFARGEDTSCVLPHDADIPVKSVGHGVTCVRDLTCCEEVWRVLYALCSDILHRLKAAGLCARGVQLFILDNTFTGMERQLTLSHPTRSPLLLAQAAYALFTAHYHFTVPVRALTVRAILPVREDRPEQLDIFCDAQRRERHEKFCDAVDEIRSRFGEASLTPASLMGELHMAQDKCEIVPMPSPMFR